MIERHVPKVLIRNKNNYPKWFDRDVLHLRKKKNTSRRNARSKNTPAAWAKFRKIRNQLQALVRQKHSQFINNLGHSVNANPKRFWSFVKSKNKSASTPHQINWEGTSSDTPAGKASLFNMYFASVFKPSEYVCNDTTNNCDASEACNEALSNVIVSPQEVCEILCNLDTNKALGPDNLSPVILKSCSHQLKGSICTLINRSLSEGIVPKDWLVANVIPVYKGKDKQKAENYRPISLLSIVSKIAERCIYNHIYPNIVNLLNESQHGFLNGKSTSTQLVQFLTHLSSTVETSGQTDVIYTDFAKAFDTVSHKFLIVKLSKFGIHGKLLKWFESYLSGRYQCVVVDGASSERIQVTSGVPQGSILGPLMFLIYINDLPDVLTSSTPLRFADDTTLYSNVCSSRECELVQKDLNALYEWCVKWKLDFNVSKCKVLTVTRSPNPTVFKYHINGELIERVNEFKDLGVVVQNNLSWNSHINTTVAKANRMMGLIKRTVGYEAPKNVKLQLYTSLVRSNLEYCTQAWNGLTARNKIKIERVQRAATRYILNYPNLTYPERLLKTNLLPLSFRRDMLDLKFFYKSLHGIIIFDKNTFIHFTCNNARHTRNTSDPNLLSVQLCRTTTFRNSYFNRIVYSWNSLPLHIRCATNN